MKFSWGYIPHKRKSVDNLQKLFGWMNWIRRMQVAVLTKMLDLHKNDLFLDLGCGGGQFVYEMSKRCKCVGIDINPTIKNRAPAQRLQPNIDFMRADGLNLPFKDGAFDKCFLTALPVVNDQEKLLKECRRVLKEKGVLVLIIVEGYSIGIKKMYNNKLFKLIIRSFNLPPTHNDFEKNHLNKLGITKCYNEKEITELLKKKSFEVIEVQYIPKKLGALILNMMTFFSYCFKIPSGHSLYFPILYPFCYLIDKLSDKKSKGNEFIVKAKKIQNHK
jgi:ubiquinone/menaquinone biosynthesis C-methylase UbiE